MNDEPGHLRRLSEVWVSEPVYFVTVCTSGRKDRLGNDNFHSIAVEVWRNCERLYGWHVGRYVIMPDHIHFFASESREAQSLSVFVGKWKEWSAKYYTRRHGVPCPIWQPEFFDRLLRSSDSYGQKWNYVLNNPVRAGLVTHPEDWKFKGELNTLWLD